MKRAAYIGLVSLLSTLLLVPFATGENQTGRKQDIWDYFYNETRIDRLLERLSRQNKPENLAFRDVSLVTMTSESVLPHRTVLVSAGRIEAVGPVGDVAVPSGYRIVEAAGKYLMPGLTDAHVHTSDSYRDQLLFVTNGITTVRDMCGFKWSLKLRDRVRQDLLLGPSRYTAGTMLNNADLDVWARVIKTPAEARAVVRQQKKDGYDFIKVWNVMPLNLLKVISQEARRVNMDLVGHIPHHVSVADAIGLGMRTLEHFKGYILDSTQQISGEDYVKATRGYRGFLCPTFTVNELPGLYGPDEKKFLDSSPARYVPPYLRAQWALAVADKNAIKNGRSRQRIFDNEEKVFNDLKVDHPNYLAGTDYNAYNPNMVAGFSLLEEVRIFQQLGMSPFEALKTATVNPARAMRKEKEYGTIEVGKRADLILLSDNPLEDVDHLFQSKGVVLRGIWLSPQKIQSIQEEMKKIYDASDGRKFGNLDEKIDETISFFENPRHEMLTNPLMLLTITDELLNAGKTERAIALARFNLEKFPDYKAYEELGKAYLKKGDRERARTNLATALRMNRYDSAAAKMFKALAP